MSSTGRVGLIDEAMDLTVVLGKALVMPLAELGRAFWYCDNRRA